MKGRILILESAHPLRDSLNAILPELANEAGATFIPMPAMPEHHTLDGIHFNAAGYQVWDKAVLQAAAAVCKPN